MQYQVCFFLSFSGDKVSEPVPEKSMNMLQKQSLNILCTIYQPFLKVYSFSLRVAVFHIRLTSFVFLAFLSLCEGWMFYNSLKNSPLMYIQFTFFVQRLSVQFFSVNQVN